MNFNWKTTVAGAVVIGAAALESFLGIDIPGFNLGLSEALAVGIGFMFAQDAIKKA